MRRFPPSRILCLTEETVESLYGLGEGPAALTDGFDALRAAVTVA